MRRTPNPVRLAWVVQPEPLARPTPSAAAAYGDVPFAMNADNLFPRPRLMLVSLDEPDCRRSSATTLVRSGNIRERIRLRW